MQNAKEKREKRKRKIEKDEESSSSESETEGETKKAKQKETKEEKETGDQEVLVVKKAEAKPKIDIWKKRLAALTGRWQSHNLCVIKTPRQPCTVTCRSIPRKFSEMALMLFHFC